MRAERAVAPAQRLQVEVGIGLGPKLVGQLKDAHRHRLSVKHLTQVVKPATILPMPNLPPNIQARRAIEDKAAKLGVRRRGYATALRKNNDEISALLRQAEGSGVPLEQLAALLGVSRQSLSKWRDEAIAQRPARRSSPRRTSSP